MSSRTPPRTAPAIALLTDFGLSDHYVGAMKAVIASSVPPIHIIDISHDIEPGNIKAASYTLWAAMSSLPERTVCVAVVDPGVGTEREILCCTADNRIIVAPDNGLLGPVLATCGKASLVKISMKKVRPMLPSSVSSTFHGRDIFAPLGARLATGTTPEALGSRIPFKRPPEWRVTGPSSAVTPAIMSVDRFGNIITNIVAKNMSSIRETIRAISVGKVMISVAASTFGTAPENTPCIVSGSSGLAEIIVRNGSAAEMLRLTDRSVIRVLWVTQEKEA